MNAASSRNALKFTRELIWRGTTLVLAIDAISCPRESMHTRWPFACALGGCLQVSQSRIQRQWSVAEHTTQTVAKHADNL